MGDDGDTGGGIGGADVNGSDGIAGDPGDAGSFGGDINGDANSGNDLYGAISMQDLYGYDGTSGALGGYDGPESGNYSEGFDSSETSMAEDVTNFFAKNPFGKFATALIGKANPFACLSIISSILSEVKTNCFSSTFCLAICICMFL